MKHLVDLREAELELLEVENAVAHPGAGATVTFVGRVRNHNDGKPVIRLEYEVYPSMALREMAQIVDEVAERVPGARLGVLHRHGSLDVGDAAIVAAASAAHRAEAFTACRMLIDQVKARVPIWKREYGPDGPYWVGWEDARCQPGHDEHCRHDHHHGHPREASNPMTDQPVLEGMRIVCITVSDTRSRDTDVSGATAEQLLSKAGARVERHLVRDETAEIAASVTSCTADSPTALLLTGGTGIGPRDVTCEALVPLLERPLEGFGETFRRLSFEEIGTRALLSRAIAGVRGQTLVFAVPGSPRAVRLALERIVIPLLPHAQAMIRGGGH